MDEETVVAAGGADQGAPDLGSMSEFVEESTQDVEVRPEHETDQGDQETVRSTEEGEGRGEGEGRKGPEELSEYKGTVSARLKQLGKDAPELNQVLNKYPRVRDAIAAVFRREAAAREMFPGGIKEMQELREFFPRGTADVKEVLTQLDEVEALDSQFYTRDDSGNYPGHANFIRNLLDQDKDATLALLKRVPAEWAKADPEGYDQVIGQIIGKTFQNDRLPEHVDILMEIAKELKNPELVTRVQQLAGWMQKFMPQREKEPSAEERRLRAEREAFQREKDERGKEEFARFNEGFIAESMRFQKDLINAHPLIKRLPASIPQAKKARMVEEIRKRIVSYLDKIRPFKSAFNSAYFSRNRQGIMEAQKNYWTPWLLNLYTRKVLAEETPGLVIASRQGAGAVKPKPKPASGQREAAPNTKNFKDARGQWHKPDGSLFTTQEILRGLHLQG